jgi:hypothetical protein
MRRTVARTLTVVIAVLALALGTLAAPAFAGLGAGGGAQDVVDFLALHPDVTCAYFTNATTGHTFFGVRTGQGIRLVGPVDTSTGVPQIPALLPGGIAGCVNLTP